MCPTICEDERVFVQMLYGTPYVPNRGDVVAFLYGQDRSVFVKRVIGLPGDIVASGPNGGILVNGRAWQPPPICGKPVVEAAQNNSALYSAFTQTHVAPGHLFVIGDNLQDSFDSRIPDFAPVTPDTVIGKPVMIYWSKGNSRIGCAVR